MKLVKRDFGIDITMPQCWRAGNTAMEILEGKHTELWETC